MNKFLQRYNTYVILGFVLLPVFLWIVSYLINYFAPANLNFPSPSVIGKTFIELLVDSTALTALLQTFKEIFLSVFLSLVGGILFGFMLGFNKKVWALSQPTVDFFRSIPVTFLIPGVSLLIGSTSSQIIFILATYPSFLIMLLHIRYGIAKQEQERILSYHIISGSSSKLKRFFNVTFYEILPDIASGFRVSLSYCIVIVTVLEYMHLGSKQGIGGLINDELQNLHYPQVYALTFMIGLVGFLLNKIVEFLQNHFIHWSLNKEV
jgi:ABC-type nitrate/sulfonate/bicarbonate transport system permease component